MVLQKNFLHRVNMQTQTANCSKTSRFTIGFEGFHSSEGMHFLWFREELECTFDVRLRQRSRRWFWSDFGSSKLTFCRLKVGWHGRCFGGWFSACLSIGGRSVEPPPPEITGRRSPKKSNSCLLRYFQASGCEAAKCTCELYQLAYFYRRHCQAFSVPSDTPRGSSIFFWEKSS